MTARPRSTGARSGDDAIGVWPIDPDPALTNLRGRQHWHFAEGRAVLVEAGVPIPADDARIAHLGIRRDAAGRPFPAAFARCPETGAALGRTGPAPDPDILDIDVESAAEIPLPGGRPTLLRAGRPAAVALFQDNLGALEGWDGTRRAFAPLGRLPPGGFGTVAAGPLGFAYVVAETLVVVPLPQLGPGLVRRETRAPGLALVSAPAWDGADIVALGARDGRLVLCRWTDGDIAERALDAPADAAARMFGPWANRLGDLVWTGPAGFVAHAASGEVRVTPWPETFEPIRALAPWRDRADVHHQIGQLDGRYHMAALDPGAALHRLDGPHLAAGEVSYAGSERFDVPWQAPAEALTLGAHAGSLLVPLLAMARDTVLLALDIPGPRAAFLRGADLPAPIDGHILHHAHGVGLRRLPVSLAVSRLSDPGALVHDGILFLWSRGARRCHTLALRR